MRQLFDPNAIARTYRDPVAIAILAIDLFPVVAVLFFGWGAVALVFLYWLENLIIGAFTLARMIATSVREHPIGGLGMLFYGPFFVFHYGMFCFVHGVFLLFFATMNAGLDSGFPTPFSLIGFALSSGQHMVVFVFALIALQAFLYVRDYLLRGTYRETTIQDEMLSPYGRIIILHFALFAGMAAMITLGDPLIGVLLLIGLRVLWGVFTTLRRRQNLDLSGKDISAES